MDRGPSSGRPPDGRSPRLFHEADDLLGHLHDPHHGVLTTERPYSGTNAADWATSTLAAGVGDGAGGIG